LEERPQLQTFTKPAASHLCQHIEGVNNQKEERLPVDALAIGGLLAREAKEAAQASGKPVGEIVFRSLRAEVLLQLLAFEAVQAGALTWF
jgi:hypothetical protein